MGVGQEANEPAGEGQCKKANDVRDGMEPPEMRGDPASGRGGTGVLPRATDKEGITGTVHGEPTTQG